MLTKLRLAVFTASAVVAGVATYAVAGDHGRSAIQKFDANGDGTLDEAERAQHQAAWQAKRAERHKAALAKYDSNRDGALDDAERTAMRDDRMAKRFAAMDKDSDGKLTLDEFKAGKHGFHRGHRGMKR